MNVIAVDERHLVRERDDADYLLYIYQGGDTPGSSWSVDSRLITDAQLDEILVWLPTALPARCCWSLGVVLDPEEPSSKADLRVAWIIGADVLNHSPRSEADQRLVELMLARRDRVTLP